ncbi:fibronectin type III domain-containing protein [Bifidobacterium boum]|uniref:Ig-like domain-containing protein n=1 Tax=Bifidobacterium boum TaxID=78343 RepID=UPI001F19AA0C|nr:Ig-like domain-containing protein [Bifidobacterium boum]MCF2562378.1 fibronectin type III domain-containing protein [Bifidobacterium boum]
MGRPAAHSPMRHSRFGAVRRLVSSGRRRWVTPVVMLVLLLGIVAGAIIVSSVTQPHVQLDDGTVWVTSLKDHKAARFNVKNRDADAGVASKAARFDIAQHDGDTVLSEGTKASNIAASTVSESGNTTMTSDMETVVGGSTVALFNAKTGNVWVGSASDVKSMNPTADAPNMKLGAGGAIAVTHDGTVYGYRASDHTVMSVDGPQGTLATVGSIPGASSAESFTVVGGTPVVAGNGKVFWPSGNVTIGLTGRAVLQAPSTDGRQRDWVAVSTPRGIATVDLRSKKVVPLSNSGKGDAARPVSTGGCVFAAWSQRANNYVSVCDAHGVSAKFSSLESVNPTSQLVFRTNHRLVVLNDVINGNVWNPQESTKVIKIQWNKVDTKQSKQQEQNNDSANNQRHFSKTCSSQSGQIKAQDDAFGARTGSQQILDVLRNDEQTDCSVLRIDSVSAPDGADIKVSPIYDGRYLQLDASAASAGSVTFSYTISDGRGQTSSANVSLDLTAGANRAPLQIDTPPEFDVEQGASTTVNALGSFRDPDGDPLTLVSATPQNTDQVTVSTRADGQLVFNAGSMSSGRAGIEVTVSDGLQIGTGMIYFSVKPANTLAATIDPVVRQTTPDTRTTIALKQYVHGTSLEPAQLTAVESPAGVSATMNATDMSITFSASDPGTYYVPYTITQGSVPTTGLVRVDVQAVTGDAAKPVAANDVALLGADNTAIVEPLTNDVDPLGGVLSVTSVTADSQSGIKTGIVGNKRVYITARRVPTQPVQLTYTAANAAGSSTGVITLQPPALTSSNSVPKAGNITAQVRTGGIVSVNVLDHVTYSDGTTVKLQNNLEVDKHTFKGLVFVSGDTVRYQASRQTGSFPVTYTVKDNLGNTASATITINVHEKDASNKAAPTPADVEAQVAAGQKVQIPVTLTGIDPDGDDVQLLGLGNKAPKLGRITEVGATYLVYEAYADSTGTDTFSYAVEDWTGQRATAQIRVGVFSSGADSGVYARDDEITLRPNTATTVPVAQNDISGDSTDLTVGKHVESQGISGISVSDNMLSFTTPKQPGTYYVAYTVNNKAGLSDTATLTVNVDANAPIDPPTAYDYRVSAAATIDKKSVDVDVSQWIANPSGTADELQVGVDPSAADHAHVKGGKGSTTISVDLTDETRAVPYTVTNTTYGITSTAFIQVPAYGVFPPTLRPKAPALKVNAHETITINIADYVRVGAGKTAYVDGAGSVSATKAANNDLYVNDQTLRFTAPKDYAGPASITFTAVDGKRGKGDSVKIVNSAVLTLPITVIGRDVPAPTFSSPTVDVAAGESATTIDLTALTHSPSGLYDDEKQYTYAGGANSNGVDAKVSAAGKLTVSASKTAAPGTMVSVPVNITYVKGTVNAGVTVRVTASNRPLARVSGKTVNIKAGSSQQVSMLADAYNPFPDTPLTVTDCTADRGAKFIVACPSNGVISITASSDIGASNNTVVVTVRDATQTRERETTGTINVAVSDKPDAPLLSAVSTKPQDGRIDLNWTAGSANGSPITEYKVLWSGAGSGERSCGAATSCTIDGLSNGKTYTFKVRAKNEVGWSKESNAVEGTPDKLPDAPTDVSIEGGERTITVTWKAPSGNFSAIDNYRVTLSGTNAPAPQETTGTSVTFPIDDNAIIDGVSYKATVQSHNKVNWSQPSKQSGDAKPWGKPDAPHITVTNDDTKGTLTVESVGNTRNAGCKAVELSGDLDFTVACDGSKTFDIPEHDLNTKEYTVHASVVGDKATRSDPATVKFTPHYTVETPASVKVLGKGDTCKVEWTKRGHADGFTVQAAGFVPYVAEASERSHDFTLAPWQACTTGSVAQMFNGAASDMVADALAQPYVNKKKAQITVPSLRWNAKDANIIDVDGGVVTTYGQAGTSAIVFKANGKSWTVAWTPGTHALDVKDLLPAGADYTWSVNVTGADPALSNAKDGGRLLDNDRVAPPTPQPDPSPNSSANPSASPTTSAKPAEPASVRMPFPRRPGIRILQSQDDATAWMSTRTIAAMTTQQQGATHEH